MCVILHRLMANIMTYVGNGCTAAVISFWVCSSDQRLGVDAPWRADAGEGGLSEEAHLCVFGGCGLVGFPRACSDVDRCSGGGVWCQE